MRVENEQKQTRSIGERDIHIVDGMFGADVVAMIHETCRRLNFAYNEQASDTGALSYLNHNFATEILTDNPLFSHWKNTVIQTVEGLYPGASLTLDRIHCNAQSYGDFQEAHTDLCPGVTAIYFANKDWPADWHGETIFYSDDGEPHSLVAPRPGRLVVFPGDMVHRGGTPSRKCFEPRFAIAFKFSSDRPV
jgi:SM-20-related protein